MNAVKVAQLVIQGARPKIPVNCQSDFKNLILSCWQTDPNQRPNFDQILFSLDILLSDVSDL